MCFTIFKITIALVNSKNPEWGKKVSSCEYVKDLSCIIIFHLNNCQPTFAKPCVHICMCIKTMFIILRFYIAFTYLLKFICYPPPPNQYSQHIVICRHMAPRAVTIFSGWMFTLPAETEPGDTALLSQLSDCK